MTEEQWMVCTDPTAMLELVQEKMSNRQLRLFGCACVRLIWSFVGEDPPCAVTIAEMFADHGVTKSALRRSRAEVRKERHGLESAEAGMRPMWGAYWLTEVMASENAFGSVVGEMNRLSDILILEECERGQFCELIRDVVGNPFRPVSVESVRLTPTVLSLAQVAYDERILPSGHLALDRLAVLSDALEEAACTNDAILSHLRSPGPHVRGCWVVDSLLGKQ